MSFDHAVSERLAKSEYLSAPRLPGAFASAMDRVAEDAVGAGRDLADWCDNVLLVGSGGSLAALQTAQAVLDRRCGLPVRVLAGKDVAWRKPAFVTSSTLVIACSWSGTTADVLEAMEWVATTGARTVALTGRRDNALATNCDRVLVYDDAVIYEIPIALVLLLVTRLAGGDVEALVSVLRTQGGALPNVVERGRREMQLVAERLNLLEHVYVLGAGVLSSLAYKLAGVLMENVRVEATFVDASELRHGPVEFFGDGPTSAIVMLGHPQDPSRALVMDIASFLSQRGCTVTTLDAEEWECTSPDTAPLVLNPVSQWLVAWWAHGRGIVDLDERRFMGKGLMSPGSWP